MDTYKLETKDLEQIEKIIKTTTSISKLYDKKYNLEISGKKESDEYKTLTNYLNIAIEVEDNQYLNLDLSYQKCQAIIKYLLTDKITSHFSNQFEFIATKDSENRIFYRILNILTRKMLSFHESIKNEILPNDLKEIMKHLGLKTDEVALSQSIYSSIEIQKALENDIYNGYLTFLEELINSKAYASYKNQLIKSKYDTSFINKDIETSMIMDDFNIKDTVVLNSSLIADLTQADLAKYKLLKNSLGMKIARDQIINIITIKDTEYSDTSIALSSILRQCLLRATFLIMDDDALAEENYLFHNFIESQEYLNEHQHDKISVQLVTNCFKSIKSDKKKTKVLSLKFEQDNKKKN